MAGSYRDLVVWQRSIELSVAVCRLAKAFPADERYGLTAQLRRAAVSVASNLAEGYGRGSKGEYRQFAGIARGSALEVQTQLVIAKKLGMAGDRDLEAVAAVADEVGKMLWALFRKL